MGVRGRATSWGTLLVLVLPRTAIDHAYFTFLDDNDDESVTNNRGRHGVDTMPAFRASDRYWATSISGDW
jgi:hypothetical protein